MNYADSINFITSKDNFYIDLGLDRIRSVLEKFRNPQDSLKCIHVAGTNGKGSVCAILDSVLREGGYKTGLYTSPHIWEYTERIKVDGKKIPQKQFAAYVEQIKNTGIHLTEFEILTVAMFLYFRDKNVDFAILETGLGGRLDATNVIKKNLCSIITHIDLDHTDRLGDTKEKIAAEKAGIIKHGCPVITGSGYEVIKDKAEEEDALFILVSPYVDPRYADALALKGNHQAENLALALTAINYLFKDINEETILEGLKNVNHPLRFEYFKEKNLIVDASHNPNGITALRENLDYFFPNSERRFVFGCLKTKDYESMMKILFRPEDEVYLKEFDYPNSCTYKELSSKCPVQCKKFNDTVSLPPDKLNIICGSFYMIGSMKDIIPAQP
ncbi:bifunctional folylpolyglutamate synthase/dihydrofolate synthase [bacterium]|nr:bifunctional folylpolyglutamate synthase/dihydrofolate synthase [bacterium]